MYVHSCCCIGVFVMLGLIQIQNPFENFFGKSFLNKKKRQSLPPSLSLSFWPTRPCFSRWPKLLSLTLLPFSCGPRFTLAHLAARAGTSSLLPAWAEAHQDGLF